MRNLEPQIARVRHPGSPEMPGFPGLQGDFAWVTGLPKQHSATAGGAHTLFLISELSGQPHFQQTPLSKPSPKPLFSGLSATEARWRAFVDMDAPLLVSGGDLSLAGRYSMHKTRLQLNNFSRTPYLYKALKTRP